MIYFFWHAFFQLDIQNIQNILNIPKTPNTKIYVGIFTSPNTFSGKLYLRKLDL